MFIEFVSGVCMWIFIVWWCFIYFGYWFIIEFDLVVFVFVFCYNCYVKVEMFSVFYRNVGMKEVGGCYRWFRLIGVIGDN